MDDMNKHLQPLTPAALKEYVRANGYSVAYKYVDEAESGRVAELSDGFSNRSCFGKICETRLAELVLVGLVLPKQISSPELFRVGKSIWEESSKW